MLEKQKKDIDYLYLLVSRFFSFIIILLLFGEELNLLKLSFGRTHKEYW